MFFLPRLGLLGSWNSYILYACIDSGRTCVYSGEEEEPPLLGVWVQELLGLACCLLGFSNTTIRITATCCD
jgi:hypothetical protein